MTIVQFKTGKLPENMADRLQYLYRLQDVLREHHNLYGQMYKDEEITLDEFRLFQTTWFEPRNMLIADEMNKCKVELQKDTTIVCDIDDIEET